jgi:ribosomal protein L11 methyltransferase
MPAPDLWRIAFTVPETVADAFADALIDHAVSMSTFEIVEG